MQITVTIPDDVAAQIRARGITPERYVEKLIADQSNMTPGVAGRVSRMADLERFFEEMAIPSNRGPLLSDEAVRRESFYLDRDR